MGIKSSPDRILDLLQTRFQASSSTRRAVAASAASVELTPAAERMGLSIYNNGTTTLYLGYGTVAASLANFSVAIPAGGFYEAPTGWASLAVQGLWAGSPTGNAQITEVV